MTRRDTCLIARDKIILSRSPRPAPSRHGHRFTISDASERQNYRKRDSRPPSPRMLGNSGKNSHRNRRNRNFFFFLRKIFFISLISGTFEFGNVQIGKRFQYGRSKSGNIEIRNGQNILVFALLGYFRVGDGAERARASECQKNGYHYANLLKKKSLNLKFSDFECFYTNDFPNLMIPGNNCS